MMKKIFALVLALMLLCGCGQSGSSPSAYDLTFADKLLESGAFEGSEMAPVDLEVAALLLGIDPDTIVEGVYYMAVNTSVSADELLVLILKDEESAIAAEEACKARVEAQIKVCESYCPAAVPRLEGARISQLGNSVVFAVGDPELVNSVGIQ